MRPKFFWLSALLAVAIAQTGCFPPDPTFGLADQVIDPVMEFPQQLAFKATYYLSDKDIPDGNIRGRQLLRDFELVGPEDNWGNAAGGLAVDLFADPLNALPGAAASKKMRATKATRKAKKLFILRKNIRNLTTANKGILAERLAENHLRLMGRKILPSKLPGDHGFDLVDIAKDGTVTITEVKANTAKLVGDQMSPEWTVRKLLEMHQTGDPNLMFTASVIKTAWWQGKAHWKLRTTNLDTGFTQIQDLATKAKEKFNQQDALDDILITLK